MPIAAAMVGNYRYTGVKPVRVLGIDGGTFTGLATLSRDGYQSTRLIGFPKERGYRRLQLIAQGVTSFIEETKPDGVYIEGYGFRNQFTLVCCVEVGTTIRTALYRMGWEWAEIPPTQLKLWVAGNGRADKKAMAVSVQQRWNFTSPSDDVVDGYALAQYGLAVLHDGLLMTPTKRKRKSK